jgi:hypothetical protein
MAIGVKRHRIILQPSYEQHARWEKLATFWGHRTVSQLVTFVMDLAVRYLRELAREHKAAFSNATLDRFGLRMNERARLQKAVKDARAALDKLVEVLD